MAEATMHLTLITPVETVVDRPVRRLSARGSDGAFGLLPRHVDIAVPLVPGIVAYVDGAADEHFVAVDMGVLIKTGSGLRIVTRRAVAGDDLAGLERLVAEEFLTLSDVERDARLALARLEAGVVRRFLELEDSGRPQ